jgi:hypothetical protein
LATSAIANTKRRQTAARLAFELPQLSASQILVLFDSPFTVRELPGNIKLLAERDLLIQSAFFGDNVLLTSKPCAGHWLTLRCG